MAKGAVCAPTALTMVSKLEGFTELSKPRADSGRRLWAHVEPIYGLAIRSGMNTGEVPTHLFWIRYTGATRPEDNTSSHVVEWNGRRYRCLDAINVADMQRFTRISAFFAMASPST